LTRGIYFESAVREPIWRDLPAIRAAAPQAKLMWELLPSDCDAPNRHAAIRKLIQRIDVYSLNLPESMVLFGTTSEADSIAAIIALGTPCLFRVGTRGAYMIQDGRAWFAPSYDLDATVDPTGCGNCATGTALYGYAQGLHPLRTVVMANLAAALNARQYGPYPAFTAALRQELLNRVATELVRLEGEN
jgi:sugar/nucleoside kinase (ribokinase family)